MSFEGDAEGGCQREEEEEEEEEELYLRWIFFLIDGGALFY